MPSKDYQHYTRVSVEDLISIIEKKDIEINNLHKNIKYD